VKSERIIKIQGKTALTMLSGKNGFFLILDLSGITDQQFMERTLVSKSVTGLLLSYINCNSRVIAIPHFKGVV
jgi:hypothetical protein